MHADEIEISTDLVRHLIASQFPQWAVRPIAPVKSAGTDNAIFRLGDELAIRFPRIAWAVGQAAKEYRWLPVLAPHLPLTIPIPVALGRPAPDYPWDWTVVPWLSGENAMLDRLTDARQAAIDLAAFIVAVRAIDATAGTRAGDHNFGRGIALAHRDDMTGQAIAQLTNDYDGRSLTTAWESALSNPPWNRPPVWVHGDLQSGNLLACDGRLRAVIDFGGSGVGDPAVDLIPAWNLFPRDARYVFREHVEVDDATWNRGRGWALSTAAIALPYYRQTNPPLAIISRFTIDQVLADEDG